MTITYLILECHNLSNATSVQEMPLLAIDEDQVQENYQVLFGSGCAKYLETRVLQSLGKAKLTMFYTFKYPAVYPLIPWNLLHFSCYFSLLFR